MTLPRNFSWHRSLPPLAVQEQAGLKPSSCLLPHRHRRTSRRDARPQRLVLSKHSLCSLSAPSSHLLHSPDSKRKEGSLELDKATNSSERQFSSTLPAESWPLLLMISAVFVHCLTSRLSAFVSENIGRRTLADNRTASP